MIDSKGNCIVVASPDPGFAHLVLASPPYRVSLLAQPPKVAATSPDFAFPRHCTSSPASQKRNRRLAFRLALRGPPQCRRLAATLVGGYQRQTLCGGCRQRSGTRSTGACDGWRSVAPALEGFEREERAYSTRVRPLFHTIFPCHLLLTVLPHSVEQITH